MTLKIVNFVISEVTRNSQLIGDFHLSKLRFLDFSRNQNLLHYSPSVAMYFPETSSLPFKYLVPNSYSHQNLGHTSTRLLATTLNTLTISSSG